MKKSLAILLALVMIAPVSLGCGDKKKEVKKTTTTVEDKKDVKGTTETTETKETKETTDTTDKDADPTK